MRRRPSELRINVRSIQFEGTGVAGARLDLAESIREAIKSRLAEERGHSHGVGDRIGQAVMTRLDEIGWERSPDDSKAAPADPVPSHFTKGG